MGLFDLFGKKKQEIRPAQPCGVVDDNINDNVANKGPLDHHEERIQAVFDEILRHPCDIFQSNGSEGNVLSANSGNTNNVDSQQKYKNENPTLMDESFVPEYTKEELNSVKTVVEKEPVKEPVEVLSFSEYGKMALEQLEKETKLPFMSIKTVDKTTGILDSKFGGLPYLPSNESLPLDKEGKPMRLLAQINCKDLAGLEEYPQEGMLQFYLTTNPRWDESVVKYYETVDEAVTAEMVAGRINDNYENSDCFPVEGEYGLEFTLSKESMSRDDNRLMALFCQYFTKLSGTWISVPDDGGEEVYELFEGYCDDSYASGHKVGGYNSAAQLPDYYPYRESDAFIDVKADESPVLLFQMDSESKKNIMWGDLGVARFFIKRSDLKARKFENAYLVWDCS
ncbi:MAG: DUF1963 domain-containing protein [Lachnospiraceae bacterium]|nr:DUF1963 domain-containing protein [Lachnospiraceae bacterium]